MNPDDLARAFEQKCLNALARREHSRAELLAKAQDIPEDIAHAVLDTLAEKGWQSDARFVEQYVRSKANQGNGRLKIQQALRQKGVDGSMLREALDAIDWIDIAGNVYAPKIPPSGNFPRRTCQTPAFYGTTRLYI